MTTTDIDAFTLIYKRVGNLFSRKFEPEQCAEYFKALLEIPLTVVDAAASEVCKSSRYWPKPVDWRDAAAKLDRPTPGFAKERWATTASGERVATYVCLKCCDTGWRPECGCEFEAVNGKCPTHGTGSSASRMPVQHCECRGTNPLWAEQHKTKHEFQEQR
jgi:hypothetical protein